MWLNAWYEAVGNGDDRYTACPYRPDWSEPLAMTLHSSVGCRAARVHLTSAGISPIRAGYPPAPGNERKAPAPTLPRLVRCELRWDHAGSQVRIDIRTGESSTAIMSRNAASVAGPDAFVQQSIPVHIRPLPRGFATTTDRVDPDSWADPETGPRNPLVRTLP